MNTAELLEKATTELPKIIQAIEDIMDNLREMAEQAKASAEFWKKAYECTALPAAWEAWQFNSNLHTALEKQIIEGARLLTSP